MPKVIFGNHAALRVRVADRDRIRAFYRDVLGCKLNRSFPTKDDFHRHPTKSSFDAQIKIRSTSSRLTSSLRRS